MLKVCYIHSSPLITHCKWRHVTRPVAPDIHTCSRCTEFRSPISSIKQATRVPQALTTYPVLETQYSTKIPGVVILKVYTMPR